MRIAGFFWGFRTRPAVGGATVLLALGLAFTASFLGSCGPRGGDGGNPGAGAKGTGSAGDKKGAAPSDGGQEQGKAEEEEGGARTDRPSLLPRETERLQEALNALKNHLLYGDPKGFEEGFTPVESLKSVITDVKGKAAWEAMVKAAGGDEIEYKKAYRARIKDLYEGLRKHGIRAIRDAGLPASMLFAETFANPLGRNVVVLLAGFPDAKGLAGVLRIRALPHQNIRKWYLTGEETLESAADLETGESAGIAEALGAIARAQEAYRAAAVSDGDGDGAGEYGFLEALAGVESETAPSGKSFESPLPPDLREVAVSGVALRGGHLIRLFLPGATAAAFRSRDGRADGVKAADAREKIWWALAWPAAEGFGRGLYFAGPSGTVLQSKAPSPYRGLAAAPPPAAGFREKGAQADRGMGTPLDAEGTSGAGIEWAPLK